ncbi:hypothetical protein JCM6882_004157 [Rhodosporidiobolus microsporus]
MAQYSLERDDTTPGGLKYTARTTTEPLSVPLALLLVIVAAGLFFLGRPFLALAPAATVYRLFSVAQSTEESLEIHPSLGLQLTSACHLPYTFSFPSSRPSRSLPLLRKVRFTRFTPVSDHVSLVINEGLQGCGGKFYLAAVTENSVKKDVKVVFPTILPRLEDLERVLRDAQPFLQ